MKAKLIAVTACMAGMALAVTEDGMFPFVPSYDAPAASMILAVAQAVEFPNPAVRLEQF